MATPAEELILTQDPAPESGPGIQLFFTICGDKINSCLILVNKEHLICQNCTLELIDVDFLESVNNLTREEMVYDYIRILGLTRFLLGRIVFALHIK